MLERLFFGFMALTIIYLGYQLYALRDLRVAPFDAPMERSLGPEDADLVVVEFVDYSCPYCRKVQPIITEAVKADGNVRLIPRPLMSNSRDASIAAILSHAAARQDKFFVLHHYFMENLPSFDNMENAADIAAELGLDQPTLFSDFRSDDVIKEVRANNQMMVNAGMDGIPAFMIGPDIYFIPDEEPQVEEFLRLFEEARAKRNQGT